jgi:hypothetical protein
MLLKKQMYMSHQCKDPGPGYRITLRSLEEVMEDAKWKEAMDVEYDALMKNSTYHLVPRDGIENIIDSKWVYKIKKKSDGSVDRYKARLVAKGFRQ